MLLCDEKNCRKQKNCHNSALPCGDSETYHNTSQCAKGFVSTCSTGHRALSNRAMLHPSRHDVLTRRDSRCAGLSSVVSSYCRMSCTRFAAQTDACNQYPHGRKRSQLSARILELERRQNRNMLTNLQSKQGAETHTTRLLTAN